MPAITIQHIIVGDIATLRRENAILSTRVKTKTSSSESSENNSASPMKLEASERSGGRESGSFGGSMLTVTSSENGFETVTMSPDARGQFQLNRVQNYMLFDLLLVIQLPYSENRKELGKEAVSSPSWNGYIISS